MNWRPDAPPTMWHEPWWHHWPGLISLVLLLVLAGLVIWLLVRVSRLEAAGSATVAAVPAAVPGPSNSAADAALEQARMRYANGDLDRDAFVAMSRDLGAPTPDDPSSPPEV